MQPALLITTTLLLQFFKIVKNIFNKKPLLPANLQLLSLYCNFHKQNNKNKYMQQILLIAAVFLLQF